MNLLISWLSLLKLFNNFEKKKVVLILCANMSVAEVKHIRTWILWSFSCIYQPTSPRWPRNNVWCLSNIRSRTLIFCFGDLLECNQVLHLCHCDLALFACRPREHRTMMLIITSSVLFIFILLFSHWKSIMSGHVLHSLVKEKYLN